MGFGGRMGVDGIMRRRETYMGFMGYGAAGNLTLG